MRTLPHITQWDRKYRDKGLVIIGVSAPEFEFEKNKANVEAAVAAHDIAYPVALDNQLDTWTNFKNRYWPAHYLIDKDGKVVYTHFGEGEYNVTENNIRFLLGLDKIASSPSETAASSRGQTPETYLGNNRASHFSSPEKIGDDMQTYSLPESLPVDHWALSGKWRIEGERIVAQEAGAKLRFHFNAGKVFLVLGTPEGQSVEATITLNGEAPANASGKDAQGGKLTIDRHTLYELIDQPTARDGMLEITAQTPGLEAYAFTFGN